MIREKIKNRDQSIGDNEDRKLALSFGAVILAVMLIITTSGVLLFSYQQVKEENRLSMAIAGILSESINRISFSGKYHTRLLLEEMKVRIPVLDSVSVETFDGTIIAHSDPSLNDTMVSPGEPESGLNNAEKNSIAIVEHEHNGIMVKEIIMPFSEGFEKKPAGIVRISINVESSRKWIKINLSVMILLLSMLTLAAIWIVRRLSRYFGRRIRNMAIQLKTIVDNSPALIYMKDFEGRYLFINERWAGLFNTSNDLVRGKTDLEIFPPDIAKDFIKNDRYVMDNDKLLEIEEYAPLEDGIHSYHSIKVAIKDSSGKIYALCGISTDITAKKQAEEAQRASEERFRSLVEQSPFSIEIMDTTGRVIQINEAFRKLWNVTSDDLAGYNILNDRQLADLGMMDYIKQGFEGKASQLPAVEYDVNKTVGKGRSRWVKANIYPVKDVNGNIRDVVIIHDDITEQKHAEEALRESEEIFRHFMENSPIYIFFKDENIRPVRLSRNYEQMIGLPLEIIIGKTMDELFPSDLAKSMIEDDKRVLQKGEIVSVDEELNGRFFTTIKFPISIDGKPRYLAGYTIDITERKQAEKQIDAERERLLVTLRSIGDAVITTDVEGKVVLMNRVAEELTGWRGQEAAGRDLMEVFNIIHEITREPGENPFLKVLKMGSIIELPQQTLLISRDGTEHLIADSGAPIRSSDSSISGIVLVFRDITEKKKTDMLLQNSQKLESLGVLAGGIAHDFNNLLSGIFGYLELIQIQIKKENFIKIEEALNKAMQVFGRTKALTQQLLTFARGGEPHKKTIQISRMLKSNTEFVLSGTKVTSRYEIQEDLWLCHADEYQIAQVLDNLIINAVQAMPEGGGIFIKAANYSHSGGENSVLLSQGKYICLTIRDEGQGIPVDKLSRIFDPFYTTKPSGTGLGLATSYSIIRKHGGAITVESEPGQGSTFTLYIPAAENNATISHDTRSEETPFPGGKILIMDDEDFMRHTASEILESMGMTCEIASDGNEAVSKYIEAYKSGSPFTAVILDLTVKGGAGGREALDQLKQFDPGITAIASSGYSADPIMADPEKFGFSDRLIKPYRVGELLSVLNRLLKH